jgi:hypothetical protein
MLFFEHFITVFLWIKISVEYIRMVKVHRKMGAWQILKDNIDFKNIFFPMVYIDGKDEHEALFELV